ncbi:glycosyltransferase [Paenibacillus terrigena]|uniref:glycosyltransferase n=1 Tax=Paenibacillus terrigena TaxID=369333 RepID=UPI0003735E4A|nr:glycosyltransferase [Paenibacillus terrigena]
MKTSIVIATFNKLEYNQLCIESIRKYTSHLDYEIIVVDNNSTDGTVGWLREQEDIVTVYNTENMGFPRACNQGIELSSGDAILLLNNDTIVTTNWLDNMIIALTSDELIGAVGTVTNNCSNLQDIAVNYDNLEQMQDFAQKFNNSSSSLWEERPRLIGYNLLIKKSVLEIIGDLDERFSPGNYEDDDLCLRIRLAGYRLMLCKDTFIHHFGSTSFKENADKYDALLSTNQQKFEDKWGFSPLFLANLNLNAINQLQLDPNRHIRILEVGCKLGTNLMEMRNRYPKAELYGIELDETAASVSSMIAKINDFSLDGILFDVILISENVLSWVNVEDGLILYSEYLTNDGQLVVSIPNVSSYSVVHDLLRGHINRDWIKTIQLAEIEPLFKRIGFKQTKMTGIIDSLDNVGRKTIDQIAEIHGKQSSILLETSCYLIKASKKSIEEEIKSTINALILKESLPYYTKKLVEYDSDQVIEIIQSSNNDQIIEILNYLSAYIIEYATVKDSLPYLNYAFELKPNVHSTLMNLGSAMHLLGNNNLALEWLSLIENKDQYVLNWIEKIQQEEKILSYGKYRLKFLLRRIENDMLETESMQEIIQIMTNNTITLDQIYQVIDNDIIEKVILLNKLAAFCYENQLVQWTIPLLEKAFEIDQTHQVTLTNLGVVMFNIGDFEMAFHLLMQLDEKTDDILQMIACAKEETHC